jgi:hypothetical protein
MVGAKPTDYGTFKRRGIDPISPSRLCASGLRLITSGREPTLGSMFPRGSGPSDIASADRVIGSCSFLLAGHGDLRIEWEEKNHDEIVKLIEAKMSQGVTFFILDPASKPMDDPSLKAIKSARRIADRQVYVRDRDIAKVVDADFARIAQFKGFGQIKTIGAAKSAEEAARADTIAVPKPMSTPVNFGDILKGADAISEFVSKEIGIPLTRRNVYNWVNAKTAKLPVSRLGSTLIASKEGIRQFFDDLTRLRR